MCRVRFVFLSLTNWKFICLTGILENSQLGFGVDRGFGIVGSVGNINGFLTGEWKGAGKKSVAWIIGGIVILMLGVSVLARGNYMYGEYKKSLKAETTETLQEVD